MAEAQNSTSAPSKQGEPGITLDEAINELTVLLEDADDFMTSELEENWEAAERYFKGGTDLEDLEGRSNVVKTEVRDAIRNTIPSIMRVLLQSRKPVKYIPSSIQNAVWIEQQAEYVNQLFYASNGYKQLLEAITESLKLKLGILKVFWEPKTKAQYIRMTSITEQMLEALLSDDSFEVTDYSAVDTNEDTSLGNQNPSINLFDVEGYQLHPFGTIILEAVPNYEFFINRNASSIEQAIESGVHGQRGLTSVQECIEMGIPEDATDWLKIDDEDPEQSDFTSSSQARRGYTKDAPNDMSSVDILRREILLTEAYVSYDLEGNGFNQLYKFFMGGSNHVYLHHEPVEDSPFALAQPYITPFTVYGDSMADMTINEQDTSTSLLRALIDNAHASNGVKIAADPSKTSFKDIMNPALNAPVRKRMGDTIQTIQIPFTGQGNLATLQYLDQDIQNKVGITKAAQGLDPDALQSTDKQAVLNTIQTGQGQTELIVRNIVETCLTRVFKLLLKLSIRHYNPIQLMETKGKFIPVNITMFDPDAVALPNVGLGTGQPQQVQAALSFVYQEQKQYMEQFGPNNPFTSFSQMYNTLEDLMEANSIYNVGRYFNIVTPEVEEQWAEQQQQERAKQAEQQRQTQPMDPSKAYITVEAQRAEVKKMEILSDRQVKAQQLRFDAIAKAEDLDIKRDELVRKTNVEAVNAGIDAAKVQAQQESNERIPTGTSTSSNQPANES